MMDETGTFTVEGWLMLGCGGYAKDGRLHCDDPVGIVIHEKLDQLKVPKLNSGGGSLNLYGRLQSYLKLEGSKVWP